MSEGIRFKTGFLGGNVSYGDLAKKVSDDIIQDVDRIEKSRLLKQEKEDRRLGFTRTLEETVPTGLTNKYSEGAQILLQDLQAKSAKAYETGLPSDIQSYQQAKREYNDYKNVAVAVSSIDNQTRVNILNGTIKNMVGTREENLERFMRQDQSDVRFENGKLVLGDGTYWRQSTLSDVNNVYMPQLEWESTEFMPDPMAKKFNQDYFTPNRRNFMKNFSVTGFSTGEVNNELFFTEFKKKMDQEFKLKPSAISEAAAAFYYKTKDIPGRSEMTEEDIEKANTIYNSELNTQTYTDNEGKSTSVTSGSFNEAGDFIFDVTDEMLEEAGMENVRNSRESIKAYYEYTADITLGMMGIIDETSKQNAYRLAQAKADAKEKASLDKLKAEVKPFLTKYNLGVEDKKQASQQGFGVKLSVGGQNFDTQVEFGESGKASKIRVDAVILDPKTAKVTAYKVLKGKAGFDVDFANKTEYDVVYIPPGDDQFAEITSALGRVPATGDKLTYEQILQLGKAKTLESIKAEEAKRNQKVDVAGNFEGEIPARRRSAGQGTQEEMNQELEIDDILDLYKTTTSPDSTSQEN